MSTIEVSKKFIIVIGEEEVELSEEKLEKLFNNIGIILRKKGFYKKKEIVKRESKKDNGSGFLSKIPIIGRFFS